VDGTVVPASFVKSLRFHPFGLAVERYIHRAVGYHRRWNIVNHGDKFVPFTLIPAVVRSFVSYRHYCTITSVERNPDRIGQMGIGIYIAGVLIGHDLDFYIRLCQFYRTRTPRYIDHRFDGMYPAAVVHDLYIRHIYTRLAVVRTDTVRGRILHLP